MAAPDLNVEIIDMIEKLVLEHGDIIIDYDRDRGKGEEFMVSVDDGWSEVASGESVRDALDNALEATR